MERDPDAVLGGFSLWITGRPYAHIQEAYGQDILDFETLVESPWSTVRAAGQLSAAGLSGFSRDLNAIHKALNGEAVLEAVEGGAILILTLAMEPLGHVEATVDLRFNPGDEERHTFVWSLDQTFLEPFVRQARALAATYPSPFPAKILEPKVLSSPRPGLRDRLLDAIFGKRPDPN